MLGLGFGFLLVNAVSETRDNETVESRVHLSCLASVKIKGVFGGCRGVAGLEEWAPNGLMGPLPPPYDNSPEPCGLHLHSRSQCSL